MLNWLDSFDRFPPVDSLIWGVSRRKRQRSNVLGSFASGVIKKDQVTANKFAWAIGWLSDLSTHYITQLHGSAYSLPIPRETAFGLVTRICSTFVGAVVGTVMWLWARNILRHGGCMFCLFPILLLRPPLLAGAMNAILDKVIGYSYQDTHLVTPSSPGFGIDVARTTLNFLLPKRFVLVTVEVLAAGIFTYLPPSTTIRAYQRRTLATTSTELASIYCLAVSFAITKREGETAQVVSQLLPIRSKLNRSMVLKANVMYEVSLVHEEDVRGGLANFSKFSFRERWPAERHQKIWKFNCVFLPLERRIYLLKCISSHISYLLSHLMSVAAQLEPAWAHVFLKQTQMLDADFQGDVLAVSSLPHYELENPLPQVTPCPLLDRFMARRHGLNVVHEGSDDDFGLPKVLTMDMLESLQYL
ncbi:hypothetical protein BU15DRAFT_63602 [Melanogaster broomeanus]|nr:hypothetical protein BU15DRAFT_63602 [Melanogaster broomeanus]